MIQRVAPRTQHEARGGLGPLCHGEVDRLRPEGEQIALYVQIRCHAHNGEHLVATEVTGSLLKRAMQRQSLSERRLLRKEPGDERLIHDGHGQ